MDRAIFQFSPDFEDIDQKIFDLFYLGDVFTEFRKLPMTRMNTF
jgi:hypothetical protein